MFNEKGVEHLRKIEKFLLREPRRFNMQEGVCKSSRLNTMLEEPPCGTACCIAGASFLIANKVTPSRFISLIERHRSFGHNVIGFGHIERVATAQIGISSEEGTRLFHVDSWPAKFKQMYETATTPMERVFAGVLRIEHFIKTKFAE